MIDKLPPGERELFEALYLLREASASELQEVLRDSRSNSALRMMLSRLVKKGFVTRRLEGTRFLYSSAIAKPTAERSALRRFVQTYFDGSPIDAAAALIGMAQRVTPEELDQLRALIEKTRWGESAR